MLQNFVIQLQAVKDRVPARGSAVTTIGILLENCKPISNQQTSLMLPLLPAPNVNTNNIGYTSNSSTPSNDITQIGSTNKLTQPMPTQNNFEKQCVDKGTNTNLVTNSNGGTVHFIQTALLTTQNQQQQQNGSITSEIPITESHSMQHNDDCDEENAKMVSYSIEKSNVNCTINEKHNQCEHEHTVDSSDTCQMSTNDANDNNRELNFFNLKLQCMCSDEDETLEKKNDQQSMAANTVDDEKDIEISEIESITKIGESFVENHRCSHCGRGHCCYRDLRCCYCIANNACASSTFSKCNNDGFNANRNVAAAHLNEQTQSDCGNGSVNSINVSNRNTTTTQNLASKRCDEICKNMRNENELKSSSIDETNQCAGDIDVACSSTTSVLLTEKRCCGDNNNQSDKSIAGGCHCRWYCVQECDFETAKSTATIESKRQESSLQVKALELEVRPAKSDTANDENRLRCCRCSRELF